MVAEGTFKARKSVRPRRTTESQRAPDPDERDENGLTKWHYGADDRQILCGTCNQRPCADRCTLQWMPDTLQRRAARANLTVEAWAAAHPDWVGWELHIDRADVRAFLISAAIGVRRSAFGATAEAQPTAIAPGRTPNPERDQTPSQERRALPLDVAMAQAVAILAGEERAASMRESGPVGGLSDAG